MASIRLAFFSSALAGVLAVGAMPTEAQLGTARSIVEELAESRTAVEVVGLVDKAETEAARYLLLRKAAELSVKAKDYDGAAAALGALYVLVPDVPPPSVADEVARIARGVKGKDAPNLLSLLRRSRALDAARKALEKNPDKLAPRRNAAELAASVGLWDEAFGLFARLGGPAAQAATNEKGGGDLPAAADFWWSYNPSAQGVGDAFQVHAAGLYRLCLDRGILASGLKAELARRRIAQVQPDATSAVASAVAALVGVPTLSDAPYIVVDLSRGAAAEAYPVSCLKEVPPGGWTDAYKTDRLVLRRIEPGSFPRGQATVTLTQAFYMGVFEVTQRQWELVMGSNPSEWKGATRPVEMVSWNMARGGAPEHDWPTKRTAAPDSFVGRLQARTKLAFDLPTEAQWEYACRAGTTSRFNNGQDGDDQMWKLGRFCMNQAARAGRWENVSRLSLHRPDNAGGYAERHTAVGSYEPNAWGLYDMHGNVWELCLDWGGRAPQAGSDPQGAASGRGRVARGASWDNNVWQCTVNERIDFDPRATWNSTGIRLVRSLAAAR